MKTRLSIILSLALVIHAYADSATWNLDPATTAWNNAGNWTPATVPDGPSDVATFGFSNSTRVNIFQSVEVSEIDFTAGASPFTIFVGPITATLTISGAGVSNSSGIRQHFVIRDNNNAAGTLIFMDSATAGDGNTYTNHGNTFGFAGVASTLFHGTSNAGTSTIVNTDPGEDFKEGGFTAFYDQSSAANSTIINEVARTGNILDAFGTGTDFYDNSTAGNAILIAKGNTAAFGDDGAGIGFNDESTADHATITIEGGGPEAGGVHGAIGFEDNSTAGDARVTIQGAQAGGNDAGSADFSGSATAGNAVFVLENGEGAGAFVDFVNTSSGGQAAFTVNGNAQLDMSFHDQPGMTVGSLAGDGTVKIGPLSLTVGTNNLDTQFAGTIDDGTNSTGSLVKTGTGRLTLSGANTYDGGTTVSAGSLIVSNTTGSATGTGLVKVANSTLGGSGIVAGPVTMLNGGLLTPAGGTNHKTTLTIQNLLTLSSTSTSTYSFKATKNQASTDLVIANGVAIQNALLTLSGNIQGSLTPGLTLTLISNISADPISGTFSNLPDGGTVTVNGTNFQANYEGGDGNDLTLTVVL